MDYQCIRVYTQFTFYTCSLLIPNTHKVDQIEAVIFSGNKEGKAPTHKYSVMKLYLSHQDSTIKNEIIRYFWSFVPRPFVQLMSRQPQNQEEPTSETTQRANLFQTPWFHGGLYACKFLISRSDSTTLTYHHIPQSKLMIISDLHNLKL